MFAYCLNNPVNGCDPCGTCFHRWDFWNDCEECKTNGLSGLTFSFGLSGSVGVGPYLVGGQISITLDSEGYGAVQYGYFGGASVGPETASFSGSVSPFAMITNAPSFRNLEGSGIQIGTAIPPYSIDYVGALDETGQEILYDGIALGGMTTSSDVHVFASYTYTWFSAELDWDAYRWATQY